MTSSDALPTLSLFESRINEPFRVRTDANATYPLTLVAATPLQVGGRPGPRRDPFQLRFFGPGPQPLTQRIHTVEDERLGTMDIFLVPIGRQGDGFLYQAIFN